jgi:hypothetical protein
VSTGTLVVGNDSADLLVVGDVRPRDPARPRAGTGGLSRGRPAAGRVLATVIDGLPIWDPK